MSFIGWVEIGVLYVRYSGWNAIGVMYRRCSGWNAMGILCMKYWWVGYSWCGGLDAVMCWVG